MGEKILAAVLVIVLVSLIVCVWIYLSLDKFRFFLLNAMRALEEPLEDWLAEIRTLFALPVAGEAQKSELRQLTAALSSVKKWKAFDKVPLINRIHALTQEVASQDPEDAEVQDAVQRINEVFEDMSEICADYNVRTVWLNKKLNKKLNALVANRVNIHPVDKLDVLRIE